MGDPRGFLNVAAEYPKRRPVGVRIQDWVRFIKSLVPQRCGSKRVDAWIVEFRFVTMLAH